MAAPLVFVVDDERIIADTLAAILRLSGFKSEAFYDGLDALKRARETSPDLLLSDVVMPSMDGFTLAYTLKKMCPACRIVLFSGNTHALERGSAELREVEVLKKPIPPATLIAHLKSLLAGNGE